MWNDSNTSHPSSHPQSCQRCIVLYVHSVLSFPIFAPTLSTLNAPFYYLVSLPPPPDFLVLSCSVVWHTCDMLTDGCPGLCNNNGRCVLDQNVWHCICQSGWRGLGCDVATETLCSDGKDNEGGRKPRTNSLLTSAHVCISYCARQRNWLWCGSSVTVQTNKTNQSYIKHHWIMQISQQRRLLSSMF